jgi:hypothetical protein
MHLSPAGPTFTLPVTLGSLNLLLLLLPLRRVPLYPSLLLRREWLNRVLSLWLLHRRLVSMMSRGRWKDVAVRLGFEIMERPPAGQENDLLPAPPRRP